MIERLTVQGFRTLFRTTLRFEPLTILIGRNGVGKSSILEALQLIGNFARQGVRSAFGPPPWSLSWQRTKGFGTIDSIRFEVDLKEAKGQSYGYSLSLYEKNNAPSIGQEQLYRKQDQTPVAQYSSKKPPLSGTILNPDRNGSSADELTHVGELLRSIRSYELNPKQIELGTDLQHNYVTRDGFGVAGFLYHLRDVDRERFDRIELLLRRLRPETESIDVWAADKVYWGLKDRGQTWVFPAPHLSWGDRQLVGLLCVLFSTEEGALVAIEEVDRGFHPSRYGEVIELLSTACYDGLEENRRLQIVATTHSPSFLNRMQDRLGEVRVVTRAIGGGTTVRTLEELIAEKLGPGNLEAPLGEIWEMGLLDDLMEDAIG